MSTDLTQALIHQLAEKDARIAELEADREAAFERIEAKDARIDWLEELAAKYKWQRDEAIADGPGYLPKDALELRWAAK